MSGHTKEPWYLSQNGSSVMAKLAEMTNAHVAEILHNDEDARRIVACVNVCAGIPTDVLEAMPSGPASLLPMYAQIEQQRDKLLAALEAIADGSARTTPRNEKCAHGQYSFLHCEQCLEDFARAAIAEVKGQQP